MIVVPDWRSEILSTDQLCETYDTLYTTQHQRHNTTLCVMAKIFFVVNGIKTSARTRTNSLMNNDCASNRIASHRIISDRNRNLIIASIDSCQRID